MALHKVILPTSTPETFEQAYAKLRRDAELPPAFPPEVLAEAEAAAAKDPDTGRVDMRDVPFVTIDPLGSTDLDQAMHLSRRGSGYRVLYAIADLPFFVRAGGALDAETRRRGQTAYLPDGRVPLHPEAISENAASLLAGQDRPALVWQIDLDSDGAATNTDLISAMVKSRAQLEYGSVQRDADAGRLHEAIELLPLIGKLRAEQEAARGGSDLRIPDQEVVAVDGGFGLQFRPRLVVEDANAQISLLTGMCAAQIMLEGKVGLLRTMPPPPESAIKSFLKAAKAIGVATGDGYQSVLRTLDSSDPAQLALLYSSPGLFRGAGYTAFNGDLPKVTTQSAVGAPYAHVSAPIRRLVDRFGLAICLGLISGAGAPAWAVEALDSLPELMADSDRRSGTLERGVIDVTEALVLQGQVGQTFDAIVVGADESRKNNQLQIQIDSAAVLARVDGDVEEGQRITVRLDSAEPNVPRLVFSMV